ncbi:MAG: hypothetical protein AABZ53_12695 [Planctomycetota bacterium]
MNLRRVLGPLALGLLVGGSMGIAPMTSDLVEVCGQPENATAVRFEAVDVFVDSGAVPMAAYEIEFKANVKGQDAGAVLVGVEGGDHKAFTRAPYYDPAALKGNRIIVAALSVEGELPSGVTRVARLHVQIPARSTPDYACSMLVAGDTDAKEIPATATARVAGFIPNTAGAPVKTGEPKAPPAPASPR